MKRYKWDFIVVFILILVAIISCVFIYRFNNEKANCVQILVDNNIKYTYSLEEDGEYEIREDGHINIVKITDGKVYMKEADCPDHTCMKQGKISKDAQSIICLPNKIVIRVVADKKSDVDAVAN